jgi:ribosome biogenesis GTPase A
MGILFGKKKEEKNKKPLIIDEFDNLNDKNEEGINKLCLKVHIIGSGDKKNFIINSIFKQEITDNNLKNKFKVTRQFKTEQFHWIAHIYEDGLLTDDICKEMENEIKADRKDKENENIILKNQVVLCFGNENTEMISSYFKKLRKSNMIFITETECKISEKIDKRYAKNIIYKDLKNNEEMSNEELNIKVISLLWELDCFFKEKGNLICRYTPDNIFNGLENENSLFTLNILVIGLSRVGKSTFINLISRKLTALESDLTVSVTKNISEYYIYHKDGKNGHGAIKLIDTPGLVNNKSEEDYKNKENQIKELIRNQGKNLEKKIHFIFVILLDTIKLSFKDANNVKEIFEVLNESKCPIYFIINKIRKNINYNYN